MTEGEDIVISGIGGKFPESNTVLELQEKLFAKEDFVTNEMRWTPDTIGVGKIRDIDTFDASPFKMHSKLIRSCDPTTTQTLERAFEALIDAGMNPFTMGGRNIGVISASMLSDSENTRAGTSYEASGLTIMGHNRSMVANRISFTFNFTGPSFSIHTSWSGGMSALEQGAQLIKQGFCEAIIVTTASLIFYKAGSAEYADLNISGNRCRSFDADAKGTCRSEGVVSFFLQKAKDAKRNYATVVKAQSDCFGQRLCSLINFDSMLTQSLKDFYKDNNINPEDIAYLEADGAGIKRYDSLELNALAEVFANRKKPLAIGSVKSNVGSTDASSSFLGITKSIIAMETGLIPPNIHYSKPNPDIPALVNGQFQPVTEATELTGDLVAVNTLSLGGSYGHAVLRRNTKEKQRLAPGELPADGLPRIIMLSARHEAGAQAITERIQSMPVDVEYASLVNDVFQSTLPGYLWKSFAIVPSTEPKMNVKNCDNQKQPLWYVFSGMGSQFPCMGKDLLQIPVFAAAIQRCDTVLKPLGVDIYHIITAKDPKLFDNILNCFVGIAAVQIGIVDILKTIGLEPDGMVGHSVGELGCSYADNCFSAEEMVLAAYARGKASLDSEVIPGMMAAIGLGYQDMKDRVPANIDVACHNASDSSTLSGPTEDVLEYVKQLKGEGVFAKAVSAGNIAYHSRYIQPIAPKLLEYLQELIKTPKPRSSKWISSSVPEADWGSPLAKMSSAEYHTNNLLSAVLFEEASRHIPKNAIVIEIAPHGLLQAILRRSLSTCVNVPLTNRNAKNSVEFLLEALGTLYLHNVSFDVNKLYPPVEYPVSRGTPYLAPLVTWDHHETWFSEFESILQLMSQKSNGVELDIGENQPDYNLWLDHTIQNQPVLPPSQSLVYVGKLFSESIGSEFEKISLKMEDVVFSKQILLQPCSQSLLLTIMKGTNTFWVEFKEKENEEMFLTGKIFQTTSSAAEESDESQCETQDDNINEEVMEVSQEEVLCDLSRFGYQLGSLFQAFKSLTIHDRGFRAKVEWTGNIVTFFDAILKLVLYHRMNIEQRFLYPSSIRTLTLDTPKLILHQTGSELNVEYDFKSNSVKCPGLEMENIVTLPDPTILKPLPPVQWQRQCFVNFDEKKLQLDEFLSVSLQLLADQGLKRWKQNITNVTVWEVQDNNGTNALLNKILRQVVASLPHINVNIQRVEQSQAKEKFKIRSDESYLIIGGYEALQNLSQSVEGMTKSTNPCIFLLAHVYASQMPKNGSSPYKPILSFNVKQGESLILLNKRTDIKALRVLEVDNDKWQNDLSHMFNGSDNGQPVVIVSRKMRPEDLLPELAKKKFSQRLRCVFLDKSASKFSLNNAQYQSLLSLGLSVSCVVNNCTGSLVSLNLDLSTINNTDNLPGVIISSDPGLDVNTVSLNTTRYTYEPENPPQKVEVEVMDYCGRRAKGERVMGIAQFDPLTNSVTADDTLYWIIPSHWSMEDAATVPVTFSLAYFIVSVVGKLKAGQTVLVHAANSPLSQACITVSLQFGADVFVTVEHSSQIPSLLNQFPSLKQSQIVLLAQYSKILQQKRRGKGIDLMVNCLPVQQISKAGECVSHYGRMILLSNVDLRHRQSLGLSLFLKDTVIYGVSLKKLLNSDPETKSKIDNHMKEGIRRGIVRPLKKKVFTLQGFSNAIENLRTRCCEEKTIVVVKPEARSNHSSTSNFRCERDKTYVIVGSGGTLWLDLAEWLIQQGARRLLLAPNSAQLTADCCRRVDRLVSLCYLRVMLTSATRISSIADTCTLLREAEALSPVAAIFCVNLDERSSIVSYLDEASRKVLPSLSHFVCFLGGSTRVCESRVQAGLPACLIQPDSLNSPLLTPQASFPYLASILGHSSHSTTHCYVFSDKIISVDQEEEIVGEHNLCDYLPQSLKELSQLGDEIKQQPTLEAVVTRSPPHEVVKYSILPVFLFPGTSVDSLRPLYQRLMHPAYCATVTHQPLSIQETAHVLYKEVLRVQSRGPYNLVGESAGGAVALEVASLLEAQGHQVEVFLLNAAPAFLQQCIKTFTDKTGSSLSVSLLSSLLPIQEQVVKQLTETDDWTRQVSEAVRLSQPQLQESKTTPENLKNALTSLRNNLTSTLAYQTPSHPLKGGIHLIRHKGASYLDFCGLTELCQQRPTLHITDDESHRDLVINPESATIINKNLLYSWDL